MRNTSTTFFLVQDRICSSMSFFVMIICTFLLLFLSYTEAYDTLIQGQGGGEGGGSESSFFFFSKDRNNAGIEIWSRTFFVDLVLAFDGNADLYQSYLPSHMVFQPQTLRSLKSALYVTQVSYIAIACGSTPSCGDLMTTQVNFHCVFPCQTFWQVIKIINNHTYTNHSIHFFLKNNIYLMFLVCVLPDLHQFIEEIQPSLFYLTRKTLFLFLRENTPKRYVF